MAWVCFLVLNCSHANTSGQSLTLDCFKVVSRHRVTSAGRSIWSVTPGEGWLSHAPAAHGLTCVYRGNVNISAQEIEAKHALLPWLPDYNRVHWISRWEWTHHRQNWPHLICILNKCCENKCSFLFHLLSFVCLRIWSEVNSSLSSIYFE